MPRGHHCAIAFAVTIFWGLAESAIYLKHRCIWSMHVPSFENSEFRMADGLASARNDCCAVI